MKTDKRTINITTKNTKHTNNPTLWHNYGTKDWMLHYKWIQEYIFMGTFFANNKPRKSSRGNTSCQIFLTNKGFIYVVPTKFKSKVLQAVKQFTKEIEAPEAIILDISGDLTSNTLQQFCSEIGTTMKFLEEGTSWEIKPNYTHD